MAWERRFGRVWIEVQWGRLLHDAGLTFIDPDQPLKLDQIPQFNPERSEPDSP